MTPTLCVRGLLIGFAATLAACGGAGPPPGGSPPPPSSAGDFDDYLAALAQRESSGNPNAENTFGYIGLYQMGEPAMIDADWYEENPPDETSSNDWIGDWLSDAQDFSVTSKSTFLGNVPAQNSAIRSYYDRVWGYITYFDLDDFEGDVVNGIEITRSGLLAGSHLLGVGTMRNYLQSNGVDVPADGYGTTIEEYLTLFAGYETPY